MARQVPVGEWARWAVGRSTGSDQSGERLSARRELVTVGLGTWLMVGLAIDGWAHNNLAELETFFTPWHAVFYSGFTWCALWVGWQALHARAHERGPRALPLGYGGAVAGVALFGLGGLGDMTWHELLGVEQGMEALFSPTHVLLFLGALLILSTPFRAAWQVDPPGAAPSYRAFLPALLSLSLAVALSAFMLMYFAAFRATGASSPMVDFALALEPDGIAAAWLQVATVGAVYVTTVVLLAPLLLVTRRWRPPLGTATTVFTTVALVSGAIEGYRTPPLVVAAFLAGVAADLLLRGLRPSPDRPSATWAFGALVPLVTWPLWFGAQALSGGLGWSVEMWTGTVLWSCVLGAACAGLMAPPGVHDGLQGAGEPAGEERVGLPAAQQAGLAPAEHTVPPPREGEPARARD